MVLTSLVLADELFEARENRPAAAPAPAPARAAAPAPAAETPAAAPGMTREEELALAKLLDQVTKRIEGIAAKVQAA